MDLTTAEQLPENAPVAHPYYGEVLWAGVNAADDRMCWIQTGLYPERVPVPISDVEVR